MPFTLMLNVCYMPKGRGGNRERRAMTLKNIHSTLRRRAGVE